MLQSAKVAGIATDPATGGYWVATNRGNVFSFNAPWYRSEAGKKLPAPVAAIAADGAGYLLVTRAGHVYAFHTKSHGSVTRKLPSAVTGLAVDPVTGGYWITTSTGHVYNFNAPWYGSEAGKKLPAPVVAIVADGPGYLLVTAAGHVYAFHTTGYGSVTGKPSAAVIGGVAG